MTKLTLTNHVQTNTTVIENEFIDNYMAHANGEYVKVYLFLLRHLTDACPVPTISQIADALDYTEKDVIRALNYWKTQGLLDYETKPELVAVPTVVEEFKMDETAKEENPELFDIAEIEQYRSRKEFKEILHVAEQYLQKTLSCTEIDKITYFYETLGMSADLIEYLIEYCVENNHKSIHYIEKVAISWHEKGIATVEDAKANIVLYNKTYYAVLNAYGIKGRAPAPSEIVYIKRWFGEYGFSFEIISMAIDRTMNSIHQPSFDYTESILKRWWNAGVHTVEDIAACDAQYQKDREKKVKKQSESKKPNNKFNNFDSRSYDMDELERKLLQQ